MTIKDKYQTVSRYDIKDRDAKLHQYQRLPSVYDNGTLDYFIEAVSDALRFELRHNTTENFEITIYKGAIQFKVWEGGICVATLTYDNKGEYIPARNHERIRGLTTTEQAEFSNLSLMLRCADAIDDYYTFRYKKMCSYATNEECDKSTEISG